MLCGTDALDNYNYAERWLGWCRRLRCSGALVSLDESPWRSCSRQAGALRTHYDDLTTLLPAQLAKAYGAYVVTTCSPHSRDLVQSLGPDEILDYKERDIVKQLTEKYKDKPFDMVFDTVGANSELYPKSPRYLKVRGILSPCTCFSR